eukprot:6069506-Pleurochrysis_carterae.AAC.1
MVLPWQALDRKSKTLCYLSAGDGRDLAVPSAVCDFVRAAQAEHPGGLALSSCYMAKEMAATAEGELEEVIANGGRKLRDGTRTHARTRARTCARTRAHARARARARMHGPKDLPVH